MNDLENELLRRLEKEDNPYQIIGSEIKLKRLKLSKTLESVTENFCSTSYLCKIERNAIIPNPYFLSKICENVQLTPENLSSLYELKSLLRDIIKAYYYDDVDKIKRIYNLVIDFDNYRANIIKIIFNLYFNNLLYLEKKFNELMKLRQNMSDFDIIVLYLFYAIYQIGDNRLVKANETLKSISQFNYNDDFIFALVYECLAEVHYLANSNNFLKYFEIATEYHYKFFMIEKVKKLAFKKAIYFLKHNNLTEYKSILETFCETKEYNTLKLILMIYNKENSGYERFNKDSFISSFFEMLWLQKINEDEFKNRLLDLEGINSVTNDEFVYLKYLQAQYLDKKQFNLFAQEFLFPYAINSLNGYFIYYYGEIVLNNYKELSHYKRYSEIVSKMIASYREIENL